MLLALGQAQLAGASKLLCAAAAPSCHVLCAFTLCPCRCGPCSTPTATASGWRRCACLCASSSSPMNKCLLLRCTHLSHSQLIPSRNQAANCHARHASATCVPSHPRTSAAPAAWPSLPPGPPQVDALCRPLSDVVDAMQLDTGLVIQNLKQVGLFKGSMLMGSPAARTWLLLPCNPLGEECAGAAARRRRHGSPPRCTLIPATNAAPQRRRRRAAGGARPRRAACPPP